MRIEERQAEVEGFLSEHFPSKERPDQVTGAIPAGTDLSDEELLEKAKGAKNGAKFTRLFAGQWEGDYASQSEADLGFCCLLGFWAGRDAGRMDRLFRRSGLFREKWDERHFGNGLTYGQETISKAISGTSRTFDTEETSPPLPGINERVDDPHRIARLILARRYNHPDRQTLLFHREEFYCWSGTRYEPLPDATLRGEIAEVAKEFFNKKNIEAIRAWEANGGIDPETGKAVKKPTCKTVTVSLTGNVRQALSGMVAVAADLEPPVWLDGKPGRFPPAEVVSFTNKIVHIPSFTNGDAAFSVSHTPLFFSLNAMDFAFDPNAPMPTVWWDLLGKLWPDDPGSIRELQKWFGYSLTADTTLQKILMLIGPPRSGKGTIARILTALLGAANVAGPTLSSFGTNFGLWALIGKRLAIISDARITGRTDAAPVIERLLSISGEDTLTIDRKNLPPVSTKLDTRLMLLSNELPRLGDSSAALSSRMVVLGLSESWLGREDPSLSARLMTELPGILLHFALPGWRLLREDGKFNQPRSGRELVEELESLSSPILAFVQEKCVQEPGATIEVQGLFADWLKWCESMHREKPGDCQTFGRNLRAALPHVRVDRPRRGNERVRVYEGLRLRLPGEEWSATVRGPFYSTRESEESSFSRMSSTGTMDGVADHRGPNSDHPCLSCGVEVESDRMWCAPCWTEQQSQRRSSGAATPRACYACHGTDFWPTDSGEPVCRTCHPPVNEVPS